MKTFAMSLAVFGALGCSLALADPASPALPGGEPEHAVRLSLSDAQLDAVKGGAAPSSSRTNSKSTNYYTEYTYNYNPDTYTWDTVEGDTYKTTTRSSYSSKTKTLKNN
jgi:hypothetical protein